MPLFLLLLYLEQPIPFSHRLHSEKRIPCAGCHVPGPSAMGILPVSGCAGCHKQFHGRPEIAWEKVYDLPYFVRFSHRKHAKTACSRCHGAVETRDEMVAEVEHSMRTCRACHAEQKAKNKCGTCHEAR